MGFDDGQADFANALRAARRQRGISQVQLADVLGVHQSNITRWERGKEAIPRARRLELIDILENRRGVITPFLLRLLGTSGNYAVQSRDSMTMFKDAENILTAFRLNRSDVDGRHVGRVFDGEWKYTEPKFQPMQTISAVYERDVKLINSETILRCEVEVVNIKLEHHDPVTLARTVRTVPATGEPIKWGKVLLTTDLDTWG